MTEQPLSSTIRVRLTLDDQDDLSYICKQYRVDSLSQAVRMIIRETAAELRDGTEPLAINQWTDLDDFDEHEAKAAGWSPATIRAAIAEIQRREGLLNA